MKNLSNEEEATRQSLEGLGKTANLGGSPARENVNSLPDACFVVLLGNQRGERVGLVRVGESGYNHVSEPHDLFDADIKGVERFVNEVNEHDGVSIEQRMAMEHGSMFGWETAGANPAHLMNIKLAERQRAQAA